MEVHIEVYVIHDEDNIAFKKFRDKDSLDKAIAFLEKLKGKG